MVFTEIYLNKPPTEVILDDIQKLIKNKQEETHTLEYKAPEILNTPDKLSKSISAFLNADGGLIILGVYESENNNQKIPTKIVSVDSRFTKETIEQIIYTNIKSLLRPAIKIYPIRNFVDISSTVYLIEIPQGEAPPYQANNNKYYKRLNTSNIELSHYEIVDLLKKSNKPELILKCLVINPLSFEEKQLKKTEKEGVGGVLKMRHKYELRLIVQNIGNVLAEHARIAVSFERISINKVLRVPDIRIDYIRNNIPSLQWDFQRPIFPSTSEAIWDLRVSLHRKMIGKISWTAQAEGTNSIEGSLVLLGMETAKWGEEINPYYLPQYDEFWKTPAKNDLEQSTNHPLT